MTLKEKNNITEGPIFKALIIYFIPILMGSILQQSYNFIDAIIIGKYTGAVGLAAVDATYNYSKLLINVFLSTALGGSILIAQYKGAEDREKVSKVLHTIIAFAALGGIVMMTVGIILAPTFTRFMHVPDEVFGLSVGYLRVLFVGVPFSFLYNVAAGALRSFGDTRRPFIYLTISSVINIVLDLVFVAYLGWGVQGAAFATSLSQLFTCIMILRHLSRREDGLSFEMSKVKLDMDYIKSIVKIGLPLGGQSALYAIANMLMQRGINGFGVAGIAAWSICGKLDFIIWLSVTALGMTATTFVAQNYGAEKYKRMGTSIVYCAGLAVFLVGGMSGILFTFAERFAGWFTENGDVIRLAKEMMQMISPFYVMMAFSSVIAGGIKGRGETLKPMLVTLIAACGVRFAWVLVILPLNSHVLMAVKGYPVSWAVNLILMTALMMMQRQSFAEEVSI